MAIKNPQSDLPHGITGGMDIWDEGLAGELITADYFEIALPPSGTTVDLGVTLLSMLPRSLQASISASFSTVALSIQDQPFSLAVDGSLGTTLFKFSATDVSEVASGTLELIAAAFKASGRQVELSSDGLLSSISFQISSTDVSSVVDEIITLGFTDFKFTIRNISQPVVLTADESINVLISSKLRALGYRGSLNDMLYDFFAVDAKELNDRERLWLVTVTERTEGSTQDLWEVYLNSLGYSGTFNDMLKQFWINY